MNVLNDEAFSDRILHIEIIADPLDSKPDSVESDVDCDVDSESNNPNKRQKIENLEVKGDVVAYDSDSKCSTDVKVKTLHISSAILATKSPFFYKLFKNGMKESQESVVTLRINASEEVPLMDVLNFMYTNTLNGRTTWELLAVLVIADKFEVSSCMSYCCAELKDRSMFHETALLYIELPSSVLECAAFQPLLTSAKQCIVKHYKDVINSFRYRSEAMTLPLSAVELVLGCDSLPVKSEVDVYDFILLWGRARYPNQKERREILTKLLGRFLHFPSLTMSKLEQIRECPDFDSKEVSKLILTSLYLNSAVYGQHNHFPAVAGRHSIQRDYSFLLPIKAVQLESGCVVFLNLTKEKCWDMLGSRNNEHSQRFLLDRVEYSLRVVPEVVADDDDDYFGLFVDRETYEEGSVVLNCDISVMTKSSKQFVCRHKVNNCTSKRHWRAGSMRSFQVPSADHFEEFEDSEYVIDGVVRIRVELTIVSSQA